MGLSKTGKIGLALSGGGARGFAHIGVLRAFEQFNIQPSILAGVSAGSIAVSLYGAGLTPDDMLECFAEYSKLGDFADFTIPKESLMKLNRFEKIFDSWLPVKYLEDLKIPTSICATDLDHGKSVGWFKGEIVPRVTASCSIPIIFPPVKINGINYVDGGVLRNLPAWSIRRHCKTLYGVNCSPLRRDYQFKASIIDIAFRSYQLMAKANTIQDLALCDHVIQVSGLSSYKTFDIHQMRTIERAGYDNACRLLETLHS